MKKERREQDAMIQLWIDRRYLATVRKLIDKHEAGRAKHLSDVVRYAIEVFVESAVDQKLVEFVDTTAEASKILDDFKINLNPQNRGLKNLMLNLQRDSGEEPYFPPVQKKPRSGFPGREALKQEDIDELLRTELGKLERRDEDEES